MSEPTPQQRAAIEHLHGPMLVVAGAGSGKTTVLARRIASLIQNHHVPPEEILAVTYTDNAAANLRNRVQKYLGADFDSSSLRACTFHSYCNDLLNRHGCSFAVVDGMDLKVYLNLHVADLPLNLFTKAASPGQFIQDLLEFITRCQDDLVDVSEYKKYIAKLEADSMLTLPRVTTTKLMPDMPRAEVLARCHEIAAIFEYVESLLREKNWGTYGHMILGAVELLKDKAILAEERKRTKFILIDEFQDSNFGQIELAQQLAGADANIFAVGDPDQAIYRFRGATSEAFEEFRRRFPNTKTVTLEHNFRSVPAVLKTAFAIIDKNEASDRKLLISGRDEQAKSQGKLLSDFPPRVIVTPNAVTEAKTVVDRIEERKRETGVAWSDFAVLYRQHSHRAELITECAVRGVPLNVKGVDVLGAPAVRDLVAVVRAVVAPEDSVSLFRVAALPIFAVDPQPLKFALSNAVRGTSVQAVLRAANIPGAKKVLEALARTRQQIASMGLSAAPAVDLIIKNFGIPSSVPVSVFRKFVAEWEDKPIAERKTLEHFCEYFDCFLALGGRVAMPESRADDLPDAVQLMSVHAAKGLEFKYVYVVRANTGSFPSRHREPLFEFPQALSRSKARFLPSAKELHEQEERRLFYVALTRAEDSLAIFGKPFRSGSKPTAYIKELLGNKQLKSWLKFEEIAEARFDLQASAAPLTQIGTWLMLPSPIGSSPLALSASAIESYDKCPLRYKIEREWRLPGEISAATQYGAAIHTVMRTYYEAIRAGKRLDLGTVLNDFQDAIGAAKIDDAHQLRLYTEQGIRQLTAFAESRASQPMPIVLATEKSFQIDVAGVRVIGRIDRMDQSSSTGVAIEDYKTGSAKNQASADESMQLTVYAMAAKSEGKTAERLTFYNLEDNTTVITERSDAEIAEAEEKISEIAEGIRSGHFDPTPGFHCSWCPYSGICPAKEEKLFQIARAVGSVQ